jgi:hypothetical protein
MSTSLTQLLVQAHTAELTGQAQRAALARDARTGRRHPGRHPGRLRAATAQHLLAAAIRLDSRLRPAPVPAVAASGTGS